MKRGLSIQDRELARRRSQAAKRQQEQAKPVDDVECACGCGVWPEKDMIYYVRDDKYFKTKWCVNRWYKKNELT